MDLKNRFIHLECLSCQSEYPVQTRSRCPKCGGVLDGKYDLKGWNPKASAKNSMWDFSEVMPPVSKQNIVSLGEGWTSLVETKRYGKSIGSQDLWCKLEGQNPSGSFKDRAASVGVSLAKEWEKKGVFVASSGNAAAAVAAYSARGGLESLVLLREDSTPSKLGQVGMYGARLLRVRNIFRTLQTLEQGLELTQKALPDWLNLFIWAPYNPLLIDGLKTIAYEIASQMGNNLPDYIFVPVAGGDLLYGIYKGFTEMKEIGAVDRIPSMVSVQGEGASSTVKAIESGADKVLESQERPETIAGALRVNFGTEHTLKAVRHSKGFGVALSDEEILTAQREIARLDGVFTEVSSATTLAGISKSIREGRMGKDQKAIAILTGFGLKDYYPPTKGEIPLAESFEEIPLVLRNYTSMVTT